MSKREIFIALSAQDNQPRGNIWRITAKKTDFYLDFAGKHSGGLHLSMHGPTEHFQGHRFHIKSDRRAIRKAQDEGSFLEYDLGKGHKFDGVQVGDNAYQVARLRWNWDLQRPRFRQAALTRDPIPELGTGRDGKMLTTPLAPNNAGHRHRRCL